VSISVSDAVETAQDLPFHLRGNYAPVSDELTEHDLPIEGTLPPELCGLYLRNGPNPRSGYSPHWFFGDGMIHGVELSAGRALSYRNRWVRTRQLTDDASPIDGDGNVDRTTGPANTHVVGHAGKILALVESSYPTELTAQLDTLGVHDFGGRLRSAMTAHPKICPRTGEMHFFGYGFFEPYLTYHVADAGGELVRSEVIEVPGPTMMHDFAITESHVVFMDLPIVFDLERAMAGSMPYRWSDDYGARVGVMPRGGTSCDVRWFEVEPCYVFHPFNAFERGGKVVVDTARYDSLWRETTGRFEPAMLHRWEIDLESATVRETRLDDRPIEFPRIDDRLVGAYSRYGYAVHSCGGVDTEPTALVKYDLDNGAAAETHEFGEGRRPGEFVFVPAGAGEDEGWLIGLVHDESTDRGFLAILDASRMSAEPVARVRLPRRVPFGFHGSWIAAEENPR
jgi:carotenoid cleavage dioxygenase-like enzyme